MNVMKTKTADEAAYESLVVIQLGFDQVLEALERLRQHKCYCGPAMKAAVLAVREARAGTLFEVLGVVHARQEREWTRLGRKRAREAAG
jgi:hypothetical protein